MEKLELRECTKPVFLYKKTGMIDGVGECFFDNYGKRFICKDEKWYQVWHYAFHSISGMHGSYSCEWCWQPKYN
jgi:hypothetical protein